MRKAEDFRVGVRYSRADLRLDRRDGMLLLTYVVYESPFLLPGKPFAIEKTVRSTYIEAVPY